MSSPNDCPSLARRIQFEETLDRKPHRAHCVNSTRILPKITLRSLCGPGCVFNPRVSARASHWVFKEYPEQADAVTGNLLVSMGNMPILCSRDTTSMASRRLLQEAGHSWTAHIHQYHDEIDHIRKTRELVRLGWKIVTQHVFPDDELAPEHCLVDPALLSYLNNKAHLNKLVPADHAPYRNIVAASSLIELPKTTSRLPLVIKAVTNETTGGGVDIAICHTGADLKSAADFFSTNCCREVVVEEFLQIETNYCMSYALSKDGQISYIGASEQIVNDRGEQYGNWIGRDIRPPERALEIGYAVMEKAASMGYIGFAGLDIAVLTDGRIKVFDLNFRYNASTVPLLVYDRAVQRTGRPVMLLHAWKGGSTFTNLLKTARAATHEHTFTPLSSYCPNLSADPETAPVLFGLLCGHSREDVLERNEHFSRNL